MFRIYDSNLFLDSPYGETCVLVAHISSRQFCRWWWCSWGQL